ncbi:hypothetical protein AK812_SmicGene2720 [Symbiodinium microadriaticum]|uniref:Protein kinase domain-containing protein n=1 Tax=Symbiodinium microadriaticum TaxID=2951 RepID=A0A1Q9F102_SYMMI|nr:hypothetical protein AK812_SmicGene2720 [Symbiodinium microadriaticum]
MNLLLTKHHDVKVADFGISRMLAEADDYNMTGGIGTTRWMAPEVMRHRCYDEKVDIYAFGLIVYFMSSGRIPFHHLGLACQSLREQFRHGGEPRPLASECSPRLRPLMEAAWHVDPTRRPTAEELSEDLRHVVQDPDKQSLSRGTAGSAENELPWPWVVQKRPKEGGYRFVNEQCIPAVWSWYHPMQELHRRLVQLLKEAFDGECWNYSRMRSSLEGLVAELLNGEIPGLKEVGTWYKTPQGCYAPVSAGPSSYLRREDPRLEADLPLQDVWLLAAPVAERVLMSAPGRPCTWDDMAAQHDEIQSQEALAPTRAVEAGWASSRPLPGPPAVEPIVTEAEVARTSQSPIPGQMPPPDGKSLAAVEPVATEAKVRSRLEPSAAPESADVKEICSLLRATMEAFSGLAEKLSPQEPGGPQPQLKKDRLRETPQMSGLHSIGLSPELRRGASAWAAEGNAVVASRDFTCRPREPHAAQVLQVLHEEAPLGPLVRVEVFQPAAARVIAAPGPSQPPPFDGPDSPGPPGANEGSLPEPASGERPSEHSGSGDGRGDSPPAGSARIHLMCKFTGDTNRVCHPRPSPQPGDRPCVHPGNGKGDSPPSGGPGLIATKPGPKAPCESTDAPPAAEEPAAVGEKPAASVAGAAVIVAAPGAVDVLASSPKAKVKLRIQAADMARGSPKAVSEGSAAGLLPGACVEAWPSAGGGHRSLDSRYHHLFL